MTIHPFDPDRHVVSDEQRAAVVEGYETDMNAVGTNRKAETPDNEQDWTEVHPGGSAAIAPKYGTDKNAAK